jgi:hypothetical protein
LQLLTANDRSAERRPVDDYDRRRNKLAAIHTEKKTLLHFSKRNRAGRKKPNDRGWPSASAQGVECVAAGKDQQGQQKQAERLEGGAAWFDSASLSVSQI